MSSVEALLDFDREIIWSNDAKSSGQLKARLGITVVAPGP